ncbi:aminotransferase class I/II-fold pyridoxal phosphate-dependent enzyme [bacterium]|nr:aminotransferase class I/II-fold pyridoxal phosphate-dependent enzyme [bacterium]
MVDIAEHLTSVGGSKTRGFNAAVKPFSKKDYTLTLGEFTEPAPDHIRQAVAHAALSDPTTYTNPQTADLTKELLTYNGHISGFRGEPAYTAANVTTGAGAVNVLFNLAQAVLNPGDFVLIPSPSWATYFDIAKAAHASPIDMPCTATDNFKLSAAKLRCQLQECKEDYGTLPKMLILSSPSNPTGAVYSEQEWKDIAKVIWEEDPEHKMLVVTDDIYARLVFGSDYKSLLSVAPELQEQVVMVNGLSKSHRMTGWRFGYGIGPESIMSKVNALSSLNIGNVDTLAQVAALAAFRDSNSYLSRGEVEPFLTEMRDSLAHNIPLVANALRNITVTMDGQTIHPFEVALPAENDPYGAFYVFASIEPLVGSCVESTGTRGKSDYVAADYNFAIALAKETGVAVMPGSFFGSGGEDHIRIMVAKDPNLLEQAVKEMERFVQQLAA